MNIELSIQELADAAGVSVRTIRYYIAEGLLPPAGTRGKSAAYGHDHLLRLRLIRRLVEQHRPLAEIRAKLAGLTSMEIQSLVDTEDRRQEQIAPFNRSLSPRDYIAALLDQERERPSPSQRWSVRGPLAEGTPTVDRVQRSGTWERWELAPGVELHVRSDAKKSAHNMIERLLRAANDDTDREP